MSIFGFSSKKEVEERERQARQDVLQGQQTDLSNLAKGSQIPFTIPFFDVFDPRYENFAVPVSVKGMIVYAVDEIGRFNRINKTQNMNDGVFQNKLKGQVTKYVKSVVTNAPMGNHLPVFQLERKILEISELVQDYVTPKIEDLFGVNVRSLDIMEIRVDKDSRGYRELKAVTTELEKESLQSANSLNVEMQRMQLEHQRETMRIQREELQRASRLQTETNFISAHQADLNATAQMFKSQMHVPQMPSVPPMPGATPNVQYMVGVNGQQAGPYNWTQLQQLVQQGQLTHQTYVWKQGMPQWQLAGEVQELTTLFQGMAPQMPPIP